MSNPLILQLFLLAGARPLLASQAEYKWCLLKQPGDFKCRLGQGLVASNLHAGALSIP